MLVSQTSARSCLSSAALLLDEAEQVLRAAFLLALDHHGDRQRQAAGDRLEGAQRLDEGHHLAFVVAGAARHDDLAAVRQSSRCAARTAASPTGRADRPAARRSGRRTARAAPCRCLRRCALPTTIGWPPVGRTLVVEAEARRDPWPRTRPPPCIAPCRRDRSRSTGSSGSRTAVSRLLSRSASILSRTAGSACEGVMSIWCLWRCARSYPRRHAAHG